MANAKKCDRCGKLYELPEIHDSNNPLFMMARSLEIMDRQVQTMAEKMLLCGDLCDECSESLKAWFNVAKKCRKDETANE